MHQVGMRGEQQGTCVLGVRGCGGVDWRLMEVLLSGGGHAPGESEGGSSRAHVY